MNLGERAGMCRGVVLGGVEGGETVVEMHCMREYSILLEIKKNYQKIDYRTKKQQYLKQIFQEK